MGISKTSDYIKVKIKMPNPSLEPPVPYKAPNQDLKDMDVLYTLKPNGQLMFHPTFKVDFDEG